MSVECDEEVRIDNGGDQRMECLNTISFRHVQYRYAQAVMFYVKKTLQTMHPHLQSRIRWIYCMDSKALCFLLIF